jgi:hypothetical protein
VYARFSAAGNELTLLDPRGNPTAVLGAGAGLVAATAQASAVPTWLITGTDVAGVQSAAAALTPAALRDHFALAVQGARRTPIPVRSSS